MGRAAHARRDRGRPALGPAIAPIAFMLLYAVAVVALVPASLLTIAGGAVFGFVRGVAYLVWRSDARLDRGVSARPLRGAPRSSSAGWPTMPRFAAIERAVCAQGRRIVFLLRLSPVVPFNFLNYALGLTTISVWDFVIASARHVSWRRCVRIRGKSDGRSAGAGRAGRGAERRVLLRDSGCGACRDAGRHNRDYADRPAGASRCIIHDLMSLKMNGFWSTALLVVLAAGCRRRRPRSRRRADRRATQQKPTFQRPGRSRHERRHRPRRQGQLHPRPEEGRIRDLRRRREAGHLVDDGGHRRPRDQRAGAAAAAAARGDHPAADRAAKTDVSGRIFLFFVDDLHLQFHNTGRVRELFKKISKELVHDGDMFGIVSSGPSSIADRHDLRQDAARRSDQEDHRQRAEADRHHQRAVGRRRAERSALPRARRVLDGQRPLNNLEKVHNRRKALVYVSDGYDFNPFQDARLGLMDPNSPFAQNEFARIAEPDAAQNARRHAARRRPIR